MGEHLGKETENYYKRQEEIADCLYKKMKTTHYKSISISDLCEDIGISRRSFYHYYQDKEECLNQVMYKFLRRYMLYASQIPNDGTDLERATALVEIWKSDFFREFYDTIEKNNLLAHYIVSAMSFTKEVEQYLSAPLIKDIINLDDDLLCCYLASDMALLFQWRKRGYDTPSEVMAAKYLMTIRKI